MNFVRWLKISHFIHDDVEKNNDIIDYYVLCAKVKYRFGLTVEETETVVKDAINSMIDTRKRQIEEEKR